MFVVHRSKHNPILLPVKDHPWEAHATFNWCPATLGDELHVVYRAMSSPELLGEHHVNISTIGHARSSDEEHFEHRRQFIKPEHEWEQYGCEDPRVTAIDGTYYIFYTALSTFPFSAEGIKVGLATTRDFKTIDQKQLVTPFNAKTMALFPEKIDGKYAALLTVNPDKPPAKIALALFEREEDMWSEDFWQVWLEGLQTHTIEDPRRGEGDHVEVGAPPIKTADGWLLLYGHIQDYFGGRPIFGIEALLLDTHDPRKIVGRTSGPLLVPEGLYEKSGHVPNIVFPSGAHLHNNALDIYYGSADTTCCRASVALDDLLTGIQKEKAAKRVTRASDNPVITPNPAHPWEAKATFNPGALRIGDMTYILYRAMGHDNTSTIGLATSKDGITISERLDEPIYVPREAFETKRVPGNSGCEDPRLVQIDNRIYMFYTAFNAVDLPQVAVSSIEVEKFLSREWEWSEPHTITPPGVMDKDTAIIPEKIGGKYLLIHRINDVICADYLESLNFAEEKVTKCVQVLQPRTGMWDSAKVGIAAPPIKCEHGWILLYHGVAQDSTYRVGAALLNLEDPTHVLSRTTAPILEPEEEYEKEGQMNNVVFPCGAVLENGTIFIYYGGGDSNVCIATMELKTLLDILE